jgi:ABC-2 type transport system permease protein
MLLERDEPRRALNNVSVLVRYLQQTFAVAEADVRKLRHDPVELFSRMIQPTLWLVLFGEVFAHARVVPTGNVGYLDFIAPGILAQSVLFVAIFYGVSVIWERDLGILQKLLTSPVPRSALVLGRALSSGVRALSQAAVVYLVTYLLGVDLRGGMVAIGGVLAAVLLGAAVFSTFSLIVACIVKTRERFMGIGQVLTMPLFFASNAIYPLDMMPAWLHGVARVNPLTYEVDALRTLMIEGSPSLFGVATDFGVQLAVLAVLVVVATRIYPTIVN